MTLILTIYLSNGEIMTRRDYIEALLRKYYHHKQCAEKHKEQWHKASDNLKRLESARTIKFDSEPKGHGVTNPVHYWTIEKATEERLMKKNLEEVKRLEKEEFVLVILSVLNDEEKDIVYKRYGLFWSLSELGKDRAKKISMQAMNNRFDRMLTKMEQHLEKAKEDDLWY